MVILRAPVTIRQNDHRSRGIRRLRSMRTHASAVDVRLVGGESDITRDTTFYLVSSLMVLV
jgi:hypothetical protein